VLHPPLLINELERIRRERGWSVAELARQLRVSSKLFYNMRRGLRSISVATLAEIAKRFGTDYRIREAVMHYLALEYQTFGREVLHDAERESTADLPASISYHNRWRIVTWVGRLPFGEGVQRGLYLSCSKPDVLSKVSRFVARAAERERVQPVLLVGNAHPSVSHATSALEAPLLIVDRIDFASAEVVDIISRRVDAQRPVLVTSCADREDMEDGMLLRVLRAATELIRLDTPKARRTPPTLSPPQ
jgi:transcriptional regulator with XRE-family HTH domain